MLDEYQSVAVAHVDGPAIALAGPGSGKTRVLVERAVRLIEEGLAQPEQLLVLTFSRKAATDLRQRLAERLRRSYATFPVTTFHAFCLSLLVRNAERPPQIAKPAQRRNAARTALAATGNLGLTASNALIEEALRFCELCDDYLIVPDHPLAAVRELYVADLPALDYGGLQREAVRLLTENDALGRSYNEAFRYVLVDEYQDTNVAQERLLELVAGERRNVFVVADEDQSIYGFRGAEIDNALCFEERWTGAARYDLPTNYRSVPGVVELATSVIRRNVDTHRNKPLTSARKGAADLRGRRFRHAAEEADWIAREIAGLRTDGMPLGEIAVLARSLRGIGPRLAYAMRRHGIPFHAPLAAPLEPTVDALLCLLELASAYPWEPGHDEQAVRALASPLFAADPLELRRFRRETRTLFGALRDSGAYDGFFEALRIVKPQRSAGAALFALWERLGYFRDLQRRVREADQQAVEELAAVTVLSDAANEVDHAPLEFVEAFRSGVLDNEEWLPASVLPSDAVALLTVHQAKGLEWEAVFVCDLVEGRFPALSRSQYALFDRESFLLRPLDEAERARRALEEERRLFYVAITRARSRLYLSATEEAREEAGRALSRFYLEAHPYLDETTARDGFVSAEEALAALRRAGGGPPGWAARAETENPSPMLPTGGLWTSATSLAPYEDCALKFYFGTLLDLVRPSGTALVFGGTFHDVLEAFHDPAAGDLSLKRLLELGDEKWPADAIRPAAVEVEQRRRMRRMLQAYHDHEIAPGFDAEVLAVERRFRVALDSSTLSGRIDRIDRRPDGTLRLVDYKSGKPMSQNDADDDLQLALYLLACVDDPELRALGDVSELLYLFPGHVAHGKLARRAQTVAADLPDRTRARIRELIAEVVAERFDFSPTVDCRFCEFKQVCPRHYGGDVPL